MEKVQIIRDAKGEPSYAVVPWQEYERLRADAGEDAQLIRLAAPHRGEESFPADVAKRLIKGEVPLKVFRQWRGLSQAQLHAKADIATQYISQIERGSRNLGKAAARKLASALGVSASALVA